MYLWAVWQDGCLSWACDKRIIIWSVTPLNVAEQSVIMEMARHLVATPGQLALLLADGNYDSAPLHKSLALRNHCLLTPLKAQHRVKNGQHHPVTLRQMGPERREAVDVWTNHPDLAKFVLKERNRIEGRFSVMSVALNAAAPPCWVRRLHRVRRWAGGKVILHNARLTVQEKLAQLELQHPHVN